MKDAIKQFIFDHFGFLPPELLVIFISALPILELRGGIPVAHQMGFSYWEALLYGIGGNLLPIIPILLLFQPISKWMLRFSFYKRFYDWLYQRTMKKSDKVEKFGAIGLILFTAIPLPTTGAYSACLAAILFFIPWRYAFTAIATGVVIAGVGVASFMYSIF
ncbi:COG2426 family protein [Halalkalibacter akibai]|uniref:Small multidrug export related protein n=1 Tax=Halalkalibacter akibai (strain ATCC 43226 / DSM 21942 / CIP 109018 / JCM 9157 / 1139) TaxID=1236973 RepID=W4QSJ7_HALA3|nr:COG2426 family protein [Halalkalibacter akibai]GAE35095.1 small multidrug export related protein [Halalkalibacter akibai JCM 9157]